MPRYGFERLLVNAFSFLLFSQTVYCFYYAACFLFCFVVTFLDVCFGSPRFVLAFFDLQISGLNKFALARFRVV